MIRASRDGRYIYGCDLPLGRSGGDFLCYVFFFFFMVKKTKNKTKLNSILQCLNFGFIDINCIPRLGHLFGAFNA